MTDEIRQSFENYSAPEDQQKFVIDDMSKAEWALKKIAHYEQKKAECREFAAAEIEKLQSWLDKETAENDSHIEFFRMLLQPYAAEMLKDSKKKTLDLPSGALSFKKAAPSFTKDDEKLMSFIKANAPEFYTEKVIAGIAWGDFKKTLQFTDDGRCVTKDGEIVDGLTVEQPEDSFTVKIK